MVDLSLPRHQWTFHETWIQGRPAVRFWYCPECWKMRHGEATMPPPQEFCPGPGPHDPEYIAIVRRVFPLVGLKVPEYLREG